MKIEIQTRPGSSVAKVNLEAGESITTEGGAMVAMSNNLNVETSARKSSGGSLLSGLKRMLASEGFFMNHFTAEGKEGELYLGTGLPGDMEVLELDGTKKIFVSGGAYVASENGVSVNTVWQGTKNLISGESLFWIELSGTGKTIVNAFGVIYPIDIDGEYIIDTGHIVAYDDTLKFDISKAGTSWMSSFLGGEGFVCRFKGKGRVWCQSHSSESWGDVLSPNLKATGK
jgi:uncharacterized protein (TIGR00266 family)